jgi:hypothetical protein
MSRHTRAHRSSRHQLLAVVAFLLVMGLLSAGPAAAHKYTKIDGNDSPGRLDLRSVSVSHTATGVVHTFRTYASWTAKSLGADSFFIIQIDKDHLNERIADRYERCAFIFYSNRLRGSLTNCRAQFIRFLPVSKPSGSIARLTIPKSQTGNVYWWAGASRWDGQAPCGKGCVDFAPNNFPDILHDMVLPVVGMLTAPLRVWENSTDATFTFPFSVSDAHSGIKSWTVQRREVGSLSWTFVASGTGAGPHSPDVTDEIEGARVDYRVIAKDKQGNQRIKTRRVYIPFDDDNLGSRGVFSATPTNVVDGTAFGGAISQMAATDTLTYSWTPGSDCLFELIGPNNGTWAIDVTPAGGSMISVDNTQIPSGNRQVIYTNASCATSYVVAVTTGPFSLDAVLG